MGRYGEYLWFMDKPDNPQPPGQPPFQPPENQVPRPDPSHGQPAPQYSPGRHAAHPYQPYQTGQGQRLHSEVPFQQAQTYQPGQPYQQPQTYQPGQPFQHSQPGQPSAQHFTQPPGQSPPYPPQPPYPPKPARRRGRIIAIIAVLALVVVGVGARMLFSRDTRSFPEGAESPEDAFIEIVGAVNASDYGRVLELIDPDERMYFEQLLSRMTAFGDSEPNVGKDPRDGEVMLNQVAEQLSEHTRVNIEFLITESAEISDDIALVSAYMEGTMTNRDTVGLAESVIELLTLLDGDGRQPVLAQLALDGVRQNITEWPTGPVEPSDGLVSPYMSFHAFAKRDGSWYYLPLESLPLEGTLTGLVDKDEDLEGWSGKLQGHELMDIHAPAKLDDLAGATTDFLQNIGQPIGDQVNALPLVERRTIAIYDYVHSMGEDPQIVDYTLSDGGYFWNPQGDLLDDLIGYPDTEIESVSGVSATRVDVNGNYALVTIDSMVNPYEDGFAIKDGQLGFPGCMVSSESVMDEPFYAAAMAAVKDDEGWHLSIGASLVHLLNVLMSDAGTDYGRALGMGECAN